MAEKVEKKKNEFSILIDDKLYRVSSLEYTRYENKSMAEIEVNGEPIAKNKDNDLINITQIFKVAGLSDSEAQSMLRSISDTCITEIDEGKYKGLWIKSEKAFQLAELLKLDIFVKYLIQEDSGLLNLNKSKTQDSSNKVIQSLENTANEQRGDTSTKQARGFSALEQDDDDTHDDTDVDEEDDAKKSDGKVATEHSIEPLNKKAKIDGKMATRHSDEPLDVSTIAHYDQIKEMVGQVFLPDSEEIFEQLKKNHINIDIPIDNHGQTALHWATALANLGLVKRIIQAGANVFRGNDNGETALMKAVTHINFLQNNSFGDLLDLLYPSICVLDNKDRSILHHITLTAGIDSRSDTAKYYLQVLIEWIIKESRSKSDSISLKSFMSEIVNLKDSNGDTALNIAARIGNKSITLQLLDIGSDPTIPNKAGLAPCDFKLAGSGGNKILPYNTLLSDSKPQIPNELENKEGKTDENLAPHNEANVNFPTSSKKIFNTMQDMMKKLSGNFENELEEKQQEITKLYQELKESTEKLSQARSQLDLLKSLESKFNELKQKTSNIEKCISEEETRFNSQYPDASSHMLDVSMDFDPDQPFRVPKIYKEVKSAIDNALKNNQNIEDVHISVESLISKYDIKSGDLPSVEILKARIEAYKENEKFLSLLFNTLDEKSTILENKFRRVVSLCTGVDQDKVDSLLEGLVQAVESDPDEVDIGRVTGFLTKVEEDI